MYTSDIKICWREESYAKRDQKIHLEGGTCNESDNLIPRIFKIISQKGTGWSYPK